MADKTIVSKRLKDFGLKNFKSIAELARQMGMKPQALQSYVDGTSIPGGHILAKLKELGCDINWLLSEEIDSKYVSFDEVERIDEIRQLEYKIAGVVPAGHSEIFEYNDWYENELVDYDPNSHVFLRIDETNGYSMVPLLQPGDLVLIDLNSKPKDGDMVAARWDETGGAVKILNLNEDDSNKIVLLSYNQSTKPIFKDRNKVVLYKVVMIKKNR